MTQGAQSVGTGFTNTAITGEKLTTLAKKNPNLANYISSVFGVAVNGANSAAGAINAASGTLDRYTKNAIQTLFSVENSIGGAVGSASNAVSGSLGGAANSITQGIASAKQDLNELLKPVSAFTGSTLGTLTNLMRDPLGAPLAIANSIAAVIDKVSPGFVNRMDATFKKFKVDDLLNLPTQIMGSIRNLLGIVDQLLAVPFGIMKDLYMGLMSIMQSISDFLDSIISSIFDFFFGPGGLLDSIFPVSEILAFLDAVGELASFFGQITSFFGGFAAVDNILSQATSFASQATSILGNPAAIAQSYLNSAVGSSGAGQILGAIRNPQQFLNSIIPPQVSGLLGQIGGAPGLGFGSNTGYGFGGVMSSLGQGVISQLMGQYAPQAAIIGQYLGLGQGQGVVNTQQGNQPAVGSSSINGWPIVQGHPIQQTPQNRVLNAGMTSQQLQQGAASTGGFYNFNSGKQQQTGFANPAASSQVVTNASLAQVEPNSPAGRRGGGSSIRKLLGTD